jgi:hypothetical protein
VVERFLTLRFFTLECGSSFAYDINSDGEIDQSDLIMLVVSIVNGNDIEDVGDLNFDQFTDIFDILLLSDFIGNI